MILPQGMMPQFCEIVVESLAVDKVVNELSLPKLFNEYISPGVSFALSAGKRVEIFVDGKRIFASKRLRVGEEAGKL